jgi:hypothetical protein
MSCCSVDKKITGSWNSGISLISTSSTLPCCSCFAFTKTWQLTSHSCFCPFPCSHSIFAFYYEDILKASTFKIPPRSSRTECITSRGDCDSNFSLSMPLVLFVVRLNGWGSYSWSYHAYSPQPAAHPLQTYTAQKQDRMKGGPCYQ